MRTWLAGIIAAATGLVGGFTVHASFPIPVPVISTAPLAPMLDYCSSEEAFEDQTFYADVHIVDLSFTFARTFTPVTAIAFIHSDAEVRVGYRYVVNGEVCWGKPIILTLVKPNPITGRP